MKDFLIAAIMITIFTSIIVFAFYMAVIVEPRRDAEKRAGGWLPAEEKCNAFGGIYSHGGFGASRCDFPPSKEKI